MKTEHCNTFATALQYLLHLYIFIIFASRIQQSYAY